MPRYRYVGDAPCGVPSLALEVVPGQEVEVPEGEEIRHSAFELMKPKPAAPAKSAVKEE